MAISLYYDPISQMYTSPSADGNTTFYMRDGRMAQDTSVSNGEGSNDQVTWLDPSQYTIQQAPTAPAGQDRRSAFLGFDAQGNPQWQGIQGNTEGHYQGNQFIGERQNQVGGGGLMDLVFPALAGAVGAGAAGLFGGGADFVGDIPLATDAGSTGLAADLGGAATAAGTDVAAGAGAGAGAFNPAVDPFTASITNPGDVTLGTEFGSQGNMAGVLANTGGQVANSPGLLDTLKGWVSGLGPKDVIATALQAVGQNSIARGLNNAARQATTGPGMTSLDQTQRQPYQAALAQLVSNPTQYLTTDPFATALAAQYKNNVIPRTVAQSGNPASVLDQAGSQFVTALTQGYQGQEQTLGNLGGFGFAPSGYAPAVAGQLLAGGVGANAGVLGSLGNLLGGNKAATPGLTPASGTSGTSGIFGTKIG